MKIKLALSVLVIALLFLRPLLAFSEKISDNKPVKTHFFFSTDTTTKVQLVGAVVDESGTTQPFVTISLLSAADSLIVKNVLTDTLGKYSFKNIEPGEYYIKASAIGYTSVKSALLKLQAGLKTIPLLTMKSEGNNLSEVKIMGSKAVVQRKSDRFIVNVEKSAMAAGNSIDLLKSTPFVSLSATNEIKLQGKKTMFLIDNKPVPEGSLQDILQMLPAGNIASVELITNPSARYDAAYGAVINIITKKKPVEGVTGNIRAEGAQGKYGQYGLNGSITYKKKSMTLFGLAGYTRSDQETFNGIERKLSSTAIPDVLVDNTTRMFYQNFYSFQSGAEFDLGKNQTLGALITGRITRSHGAFNSNNIFRKYQAPVDSILFTSSPFTNRGSTYNYNINYHLLSDSGKNELSVLATYTPYRTDFYQHFSSFLVGQNGQVIRTPPIYQSDNNTAVDIWIAQVDYNHKFGSRWRLESGVKNQRTISRNTIDYEDNRTGVFNNVPQFSSDNRLKEIIYSGYGIISKDWDKDKLQLGLRIENTDAEFKGNFSQHYFKAFPTINFQHDLSDQYNFSLSYKKTISRAPYNELVPYTTFINQYTAFIGNPALLPQYDNVFTLNTKLNKVNVIFTYSSSKGMFGQFPSFQDYNTKVTYFSLQNLESSHDFYIDVFYPLRINSWWSTQNSGSVFGYSKATGYVLGEPFSLSSHWYNLKTDHTFEISKDIKLQVIGYYSSSLSSELTNIGSVGNIDASLMINVLKGNAQIRVGGTDILKRNVYYSEQNFDNYRSRKDRYADSRRVSLGFTYNFGKVRIATPGKKLGNKDAVDRL
ncbi:outer membrane beta-barrel protein [Pedobacter sp. PAMC26386]|nr:outer membrane beta-barrel protein [Pedobacter sp. PAMC26386]